MKGFRVFRVEGQQPGAAQTEAVAHPGECRHFGHATKLNSFKSHSTHEGPRFGGPSLRLLRQEGRPSRGFRVFSMGGGDTNGAGGTDTRRETIYVGSSRVTVWICTIRCSGFAPQTPSPVPQARNPRT